MADGEPGRGHSRWQQEAGGQGAARAGGTGAARPLGQMEAAIGSRTGVREGRRDGLKFKSATPTEDGGEGRPPGQRPPSAGADGSSAGAAASVPASVSRPSDTQKNTWPTWGLPRRGRRREISKLCVKYSSALIEIPKSFLSLSLLIIPLLYINNRTRAATRSASTAGSPDDSRSYGGGPRGRLSPAAGDVRLSRRSDQTLKPAYSCHGTLIGSYLECQKTTVASDKRIVGSETLDLADLRPLGP